MLVRLEARDFRNLAPLSWELPAGSHLILGQNGAGKTSLLEAVYLLATTRSFRTSLLTDCRHHDSSSLVVRGEVEDGRRVQLEVQLSGKESQRRLNGQLLGAQVSLADYLAVLPVISWSTQQGQVLSGGPGERRRFLDRGILGSQPKALAVLTRYRQTLRAKRQLLLTGGNGISAWNELLAESGAELIRLRAAYVAELTAAAREIAEQHPLGFQVMLRYHCSPRNGEEGSAAIFAELSRSEDKERKAGQPLLGPHRDELEILWSDHPLRRVASAGERKALGLILLLAQGGVLKKVGRQPLYLLDDLDSELDSERLAVLWRAFRQAEQTLVSSNRAEVWQALALDHRWHCTAGRLLPGRDSPS